MDSRADTGSAAGALAGFPVRAVAAATLLVLYGIASWHLAALDVWSFSDTAKHPWLAVARILWAAGFLAGAAGIGHALLRRMPDRRLARLGMAAEFGVGTMLLGGWAFFLAAVGLLNGAGFLATQAVIAAGIGAFFLGRRRASRRPGFGNRTDRLLTLLFAGAALAILVYRGIDTLTPPYSWDEHSYHLRAPAAWLEAGRMVHLPLNLQAAMPMNIQCLYLVGMWTSDDTAPKQIHWLFAMALVPLLVGCGRRLGSGPAGALAAVFFVANYMVFFEAGVAYIDLAIAFHVVLWLRVFLEFLRRPTALRMGVLGLLAGYLAGCKYTAVMPVVALGLAAVVMGTLRERGALLRPAWLAVGAGSALVVFLPWAIRALVTTGNPVYPLGVGGRDYTLAMLDALVDWQRTIGMGRSATDYMLLPLRVAFLGEDRADRFAGELYHLPFVLAPLGLVVLRRRGFRIVFVGFWLAFALWALGSQQSRFLIPALPLLALSSALALWHLPRRFPPRALAAWGRVLLLGGFVYTIVAVVPMLVAKPEIRGDAIKYIRGDITGREFLRVRMRVLPVYEWLEEEIAAGRIERDARVLFLFENNGLYSPLPYVADGAFEAALLANMALEAPDADAFARAVGERFAPDLVLINEFSMDAYESAILDPDSPWRVYTREENRQRLVEAIGVFRRYLAQHGREIHRHNGIVVYELDSTGDPGSNRTS